MHKSQFSILHNRFWVSPLSKAGSNEVEKVTIGIVWTNDSSFRRKNILLFFVLNSRNTCNLKLIPIGLHFALTFTHMNIMQDDVVHVCRYASARARGNREVVYYKIQCNFVFLTYRFSVEMGKQLSDEIITTVTTNFRSIN